MEIGRFYKHGLDLEEMAPHSSETWRQGEMPVLLAILESEIQNIFCVTFVFSITFPLDVTKHLLHPMGGNRNMGSENIMLLG